MSLIGTSHVGPTVFNSSEQLYNLGWFRMWLPIKKKKKDWTGDEWYSFNKCPIACKASQPPLKSHFWEKVHLFLFLDATYK